MPRTEVQVSNPGAREREMKEAKKVTGTETRTKRRRKRDKAKKTWTDRTTERYNESKSDQEIFK